MILQALTDYYETLLSRGEEGVPPVGWSAAKVSYALSLSPSGTLLNVLPLKREVQRGKKTAEVPQVLIVPFQQEKGAGIAPNFLCDNAVFLLGLDLKGKPERSRKAFEATRDLHLSLLRDVTGPVGRAVAAFFGSWDPARSAVHEALIPFLEELAGGNLVFRVDGQYAHEDPELSRIWQAEYDRPGGDDIVLPCLVTGEAAPAARTHPIIRGIRGAPTTGSKLVGFNDSAYESYGKTQSYNAPVSKRAAFAYATALNLLLADDRHKKILGDTTIVYWAQSGEEAYSFSFGQAIDPQPELDDVLLNSILDAVVHGRPVNLDGLNADMPFYILGLAPNAARISVRFFLEGAFGSFLKHLGAHYQRLEIVRPSFDNKKYLSIHALVWETINKNSRDKAPDSAMAARTLSAILRDAPYPAALYRNTLLRIHAEHQVTRGQAAILKAHLRQDCRRQGNYEQLKEASDVELNESCSYPPYVLGRLFAVLESIQEASVEGKLSATIKDRFFSAAGSTPAPIFAQLFRLESSHMKKLHRDKPGLAVNLEKCKRGLMVMLQEPIPLHLSLEDQCTFQLGYYHQRQAFYGNQKEASGNE